MLYNRPVSLALGYFIVNLKDAPDVVREESIGYLQHNLKTKVGDNEYSIRNGILYGPIDYEWAFGVPKCRYQAPADAIHNSNR